MALPSRLPRNLIAQFLRISTWNVHGGIKGKSENAQLLMKDLERTRTDLACLQETYTKDVKYGSGKGKLHCFSGRYGQAFYVSTRLAAHLYGYEKITDRISVLYLMLSKSPRATYMAVINVYGPTSMLAQRQPAILDTFYEDLASTLEKCKKKASIIIFGGDFNAKLGKKIEQGKILAATDMVYETIMDGNWLCSWKTIYFVLPIHSSSILPSMWLHGGALTKKDGAPLK
jgi:exonuclease III